MISEYLRGLRALVGTQLVLVPSASVLFRDDAGRVLLVRKVGAELWETIGGAIDPDESPRDAAHREAVEEVGIAPVGLRLLGVFGGPEFRVVYPHGDVVSYVPSVFEARTGGVDPVPDGDEIGEARWFEVDELDGLSTVSGARSIFAQLGLTTGGVHALDHVQLAMPAGREADVRAFYVGVLGLTEEPKPPHLAARGGVWFRGGDARLHLGVDPDFRPATKAHPALLVRDLAAVNERLRAAGIEPTTDQPLEGYDRVYVTDPFGNRIELMQRLD